MENSVLFRILQENLVCEVPLLLAEADVLVVPVGFVLALD